MTTIYCENTNCIHYDTNSFTCNNSVVTISGFYDEGCENYESYLEVAEYQNKYYVAVKVDGVVARSIRYGKKIEYNGRVFFTEARVTDDEEYTVTDERTGYMCGTFKHLKSKWDKFIEHEKNIPDVKSYPLAEKGKDGKYRFIDARNCDIDVKWVKEKGANDENHL